MLTSFARSMNPALMRSLLTASIALTVVSTRSHAHPGIGIVRDSRGNVYYTDTKSVWKETPEGRKSIVVANVHTHELYMSPGDSLYGEHLWHEGNEKWGHYIWRLSPSGVLDTIVRARSGFRDDYDDIHFVHDETGAMYWADIARDSMVIRKRMGSAAPIRLGRVPHGRPGWLVASKGSVYFAADGDLYQLDARGVARVLASGISEHAAVPLFVRFVAWVTTPFQGAHPPDHDVGGLWIDRDDNVYAAVPGGRVVKRISPRGEVKVVARSDGDWTAVSGLALPDGSSLLLEGGPNGAVRTRRIPP